MHRVTLRMVAALLMVFSAQAGFCHAATPQQKAVIAEIKALGGTVTIDENDPTDAVVKINLNKTKVTDDFLKKLRVFPKLRSLGIYETNITDEGVKHLVALKSLETLNLYHTKITDKALEHVKELPELRTLTVCSNPVTDKGLEQLKDMTKLKDIYCFETKFTNDGLKKLRVSLPDMRVNHFD